jgi:phosphogluconate dehydratase
MGLQLPGASFVNPGTPLRAALTKTAARRVVALAAQHEGLVPFGRIVDAKAIVNGIVGLLASGGSTNHTIHLVAIAKAAGLRVDWDDFAALSSVVPLLARVYPNGGADVNAACGGGSFAVSRAAARRAGRARRHGLRGGARYAGAVRATASAGTTARPRA